MQTFKQSFAAVALVAAVGLIVPGSLGGSVVADVTHNPHLNQYNDPFPLSCDLDGDSSNDTTYVASHYEAPYYFQSVAKSESWHDRDSNTIMTQHERIDVLRADYVALAPVPLGYPSTFTDNTVEWYDYYNGSDVYRIPPGRKMVRCVNISEPYEYTNSEFEAGLDQEHQIAADVPYDEVDYQLFVVKLSASGKTAKGKGQTYHAHKHHGKHHGKGKHHN